MNPKGIATKERKDPMKGILNFALLVLQSVRIFARREDFGLRWQSTATTPLFGCGQSFQSGVALRFPPQSKTVWVRLYRAVFSRGKQNSSSQNEAGR